MRSAVFPMCLLVLAAAEEQIDPNIYVKLFMGNKPLFDRMSEAVLERLPVGGTVLDIGSGPGEPTVTIASASPGSRVVCTDVQPEMNEKAKGRVTAAGLDNVDFAVTSADDLSAWVEGTFDAVTMNLVLMFVKDKAKSLKEVARVLKPGGFAYTSVWKELSFYDMALSAIAELAGKPMTLPIDPMTLSANNAVEEVAEAAGLKMITNSNMNFSFTFETPKLLGDGLTILVGSTLKQLEAEGFTGATAKFYKIVGDQVQKKGWNSAGEVTMPGLVPQVLILGKPAKDEL